MPEFIVIDYITDASTTHATFKAALEHARLLAAKHVVALGFPVVERDRDPGGVMLFGADPSSGACRALASVELAPVDWQSLLEAA